MLTQPANEAMDRVHPIASSLSKVTQAAQNSWASSLQQGEQLKNTTLDRLQHALFGSVQDWIAAHSWLQWGLSHPLYSFGLALLVLFLLAGLLRAIAHLTERIWLFILRAPLKLGQWLVVQVSNGFRSQVRPPHPAALATPNQISENPQERLQELLHQLEALRQQQDTVMQEIKTIVALEQQDLNKKI